MRLTDLLSVQRVTPRLDAADKSGVLCSLAKLFAQDIPELNSKEIFHVLTTREMLASTGIGSGVAIPHGRMPQLSSLKAALAIHEQGVLFESADDQPTHIFFSLLAPEAETTDHLRALARISRLLRDENVREQLRKATTPQALFDIVREREIA